MRQLKAITCRGDGRRGWGNHGEQAHLEVAVLLDQEPRLREDATKREWRRDLTLCGDGDAQRPCVVWLVIGEQRRWPCVLMVIEGGAAVVAIG